MKTVVFVCGILKIKANYLNKLIQYSQKELAACKLLPKQLKRRNDKALWSVAHLKEQLR